MVSGHGCDGLVTQWSSSLFCLLSFYVLATSKVISGCQCTVIVTLGNQAISTMIWHPTQSYYSDSELTNHCPIANNAKHLARKQQISILWVIGLIRAWIQTHDLPHARSVLYLFGHCAQLGRDFNVTMNTHCHKLVSMAFDVAGT